MNNLIRLNPIQWPYSLMQLKEDEPSYSFSLSPSKEELAYFDVYHFEDVVTLVNPPEYDPASHKLEQKKPVEINGILTQQWELIELTEFEKESYYHSTHPPRWIEFGSTLMNNELINDLLTSSFAVSPSLTMALTLGLSKAADGDSRVFLGAWQSARSLGLVSAELVASTQAAAVAHDLPAEFVEELG